MYMLNMVIILIVMYSNVVTAIDKIPTYLLRFNNTRFYQGIYYASNALQDAPVKTEPWEQNSTWSLAPARVQVPAGTRAGTSLGTSDLTFLTSSFSAFIQAS